MEENISAQKPKLTIKERLARPRRQYVKAAIWSLLYILFIVWVGNFWWLLLLPFIFDAFVTKFIPYDWWKKYKTTKHALYVVCSWVDAIIFALVAVYFINLYLFQNYQIPTSSLEKSLLVGDFLYVSKAAYGPRIPNTPLSMPLVQNTFPEWLGGGKSYFEKPQWEYRRLKGWDTLDRGDIVVFNFPAGDTVCTKMQNPDYYTLCHYLGRDYLESHKAEFGEIVWRPVDRRENYVKRCVGLPGDTLQIIDNVVYINGEVEPERDGVQLNYFVQTTGGLLNDRQFERLGISRDDRQFATIDDADFLTEMGFDLSMPIYHLPLTRSAFNTLEQQKNVALIAVEPARRGGRVYPLDGDYGWSRDNYGPIYIPKKGETIALTLENLPIYSRIIGTYEHHTLAVTDSAIIIDGQPATTYTFGMDYFWMQGDNRHNSADSRYWGFVPEDHIVGRPMFVWLSLDKDKSLFHGKIRWNRFFKDAKN